MSLSAVEKEELMDIIEIAFGPDSSIENVKSGFNDETVDAVETALNELLECNAAMKELIVNLLGGARYPARGWLKKIIGQFRRELNNNKLKFNGAACRNTAHIKWRQAIIITTY